MPYLVRYGELFLKSEPVRKQMIQQLVRNIGAGLPGARIRVLRGRIVVDAEHPGEILQKVFGITSFSNADEVETGIDAIKNAVLEKYERGKTFAVRVNRAWKNFPLTSQETAAEIGAHIVEKTGASVDLKNPGQAIFVDIMEHTSFIFTEKIPGTGGLPLGVSGRVCARNKSERTLAAAWMLMKRGCDVSIVGAKAPGLEKWAIGRPIEYLEKMPDNCLAEVSGDEEPCLEKREFPVFQPLLGVEGIGQAIERVRE